MSASIEDLWDTPAEPSTPRKRSSPIPVDDDDDEPAITQRPAKRQALFLADSDDDEPLRTLAPQPSASISRQALEGMFDLDDDEVDVPSAPGMTPHAILSSSPAPEGDGETGKGKGKDTDEFGAKKRKKAARMDAQRLVGDSGFPALIQSTKGFAPKGKGHEAEDLNRLLQVYQYWTHRMYPKTQFKDTVATVEKLCHSRRMHVSLGVWRDEAKGLINGKKPGEADDRDILDLTSDVEPDPDPQRSQPPQSSSPPAEHDMDMELDQPTRPPSSGTDYDDDEGAFDMDALLKEQEEEDLQKLRASAAAASARVAPKQVETMEDDEMDSLWAELNDAPSASAPPPPPRAAPDDDEMWDIMQYNEPEAAPWVPPSAPVMEEPAVLPAPGQGVSEAVASTGEAQETVVQPTAQARPTNDDDWDDMYQ